MDTEQKLSVSDCLLDGLKAFWRNKWPAMGCCLLIYLILTAPQHAPRWVFTQDLNVEQAFTIIKIGHLAMLAFFVCMPAVLAGLCRFGLSMARGQRPRAVDLLAGFRRLGAVHGAYWSMVGIIAVSAVPLVLTMVVSFEVVDFLPPAITMTLLVFAACCYFLVLAAYFTVPLRFWPVFFFLMDESGLGPLNALGRSWHLGRGSSSSVFCLGIILLLMGIAPDIPWILTLPHASAWDPTRTPEIGDILLAELRILSFAIWTPIVFAVTGTAYLKLREMKEPPAEAIPVSPIVDGGPPSAQSSLQPDGSHICD